MCKPKVLCWRVLSVFSLHVPHSDIQPSNIFKARQKFSSSTNFFPQNKAICLPPPKNIYLPQAKSFAFRLMKVVKKRSGPLLCKIPLIHISLIYHCHSLLEENYDPAPVILSLSGQIGSAQRALLLFAVMFETDKSHQTSMEKSQ